MKPRLQFLLLLILYVLAHGAHWLACMALLAVTQLGPLWAQWLAVPAVVVLLFAYVASVVMPAGIFRWLDKMDRTLTQHYP